MTRFFDTLEHRLLAVLSVLFTINTFFFIVREVDNLTSLAITPVEETRIFYALYAVLGVLTAGTITFFAKRFDWKLWLGKTLLVFAPAETLLIYALSQSRHYHYFVFLAAGLYVILAGTVLVALRHTRRAAEAAAAPDVPGTPGAWFRSQGPWRLSLVLFVTLAYLTVGLWKVSDFAAVDEALWTFDRIPNFWRDVSYRIWDKTTVSDKPGVTVAYVSGIGLTQVSPKAYRDRYWNDGIWRQTHDIRDMNFPLRAPIVVFTALMLPLFYFLIERVLGRPTALIATVLIAAEPITLGMARIVNPDSLLWTFTPLALLAYLAYRRRDNPWYLYLSGFLLGLALLTKYVANILLVFLLGFIFLEYVFLKKQQRADTSPERFFKGKFFDYLTVTFVSLVTFYVFYPVVWVKPAKLLNATLLSQAFESTWPLFIGLIAFLVFDHFSFRNRITAGILDFLADHRTWLTRILGGTFFICALIVIWNVWDTGSPYNFQEIVASPKSSYSAGNGFIGVFFANFYPFLFGITPLALVGFVAGVFRLLTRPLSRQDVQVTFTILLFIFLYYLGATVNHVALMNRYQIVIYPLGLIVAAIGLQALLSWLRRTLGIPGRYATLWRAGALVVILALSAWSLRTVAPHYQAYASGFLPDRYYVDVKDMGTGSYEAAQYLNSLPDARSLAVWTDKSGVCAFFVGKCYSTFNFQKVHEKNISYVVVSAGRQSRTTKMLSRYDSQPDPQVIRFDHYYGLPDDQAEFVLHPDGRSSNFIKVFRYVEGE